MKKVFNKISTYELLFVLLIPIYFFVKMGWRIDNDIWFILNIGRYIFSNGFPHVEIFTIHEGLKYVIQQWGYCVITWPVYKLCGIVGIYIINCILFSILYFLYYRLCYKVSNNKKVSILISALSMFLMVICHFITLRSQMLSYIFLVIVLLIWEEYIKNSNNKILILLPIVSILQSNFHASMWWMLIIYSLPFIVELFFNDKKKFKIGLITLIIMIFAGCINPYGIDAVNYLINSYNMYANKYIKEMNPVSSMSEFGLSIILVLFIYGLYIFFNKKNNYKLRYLFLIIGSIALAFTAKKSVCFFLLGAVYPLAYLFKDYLNNKDIIFSKRSNKYKVFYFMIWIILISFTIYKGTKMVSFYNYFVNYKGLDYIEERYDKNDIKLYTHFNIGSYAEYRGFKCYIDSRAEVFYYTMNKKANIFNDYYAVQIGETFPDEFLSSNDFTHLLIVKEDRLYNYDEFDNYTLVDSGDDYKLYERVGYNES